MVAAKIRCDHFFLISVFSLDHPLLWVRLTSSVHCNQFQFPIISVSINASNASLEKCPPFSFTTNLHRSNNPAVISAVMNGTFSSSRLCCIVTFAFTSDNRNPQSINRNLKSCATPKQSFIIESLTSFCFVPSGDTSEKNNSRAKFCSSAMLLVWMTGYGQ
jgi:hypothetical protein